MPDVRLTNFFTRPTPCFAQFSCLLQSVYPEHRIRGLEKQAAAYSHTSRQDVMNY